MKAPLSFLAGLLLLTGSGLLYAAEQTTLTGKLLCADCALKEGDKCQSVLVVKQGDQEQKYYLTSNDVDKKAHKSICSAPKDNVTVTGTVEEKDGKKWLTASKVEGLDSK